jgi:UDP-N-acetylmuramate dehydrogenase
MKHIGHIPATIQHMVPLCDKNWFGTGGSATYFCTPTTILEMQEILAWASGNHIAFTIVGEGANILIADEGISGLVIRPANTDITIVDIQGNTVFIQAGAGVSMDVLITWALEQHYIGLEEFSGIPGTVGGSVYINLHYYQFLLEHFLIKARVLECATGQVLEVTADWFQFGYNQSRLQKREHLLFDAIFMMHSTDPIGVAYAKGRRIEIIRHRMARYPAKNTCGSFFRNFLSDEVILENNGKKLIYVAYYLDKIGVKGSLRVGNAIVSHQHANMIVNMGNATSKEIITLARTMQELVKEQFNIVPQPECQLLGFANNPLL